MKFTTNMRQLKGNLGSLSIDMKIKWKTSKWDPVRIAGWQIHHQTPLRRMQAAG